MRQLDSAVGGRRPSKMISTFSPHVAQFRPATSPSGKNVIPLFNSIDPDSRMKPNACRSRCNATNSYQVGNGPVSAHIASITPAVSPPSLRLSFTEPQFAGRHRFPPGLIRAHENGKGWKLRSQLLCPGERVSGIFVFRPRFPPPAIPGETNLNPVLAPVRPTLQAF